MMSEKKDMDRREFFRKSATGAAALGLAVIAAPNIVHALGANDRINLGVIGCGGRGTGHVRDLARRSKGDHDNIMLVAVCDIYEPRKKRALDIAKSVNPDAKLFHDYLDMLAMKDLDGVVIATPDHWHAKMSIDAMEAGKDVYVEKPMTRYWREAKEVAATTARTGRVLQVGVQSTSDGRFWRANELIKEGALGKLIWSQTGYFRNVRNGDWNYGIDWNASPKNLDWERFLGPAPKRPFEHERYFRFRKFWDYSGGLATDLLYHALAHLEIALGPELPKRVMASGGIYVHHDREVPDTFHVLVDYPTDHTVALFSTQANRQGVSEMIRGQEATMYFESPGVVIRPEPGYEKKRPEIKAKGKPMSNHMSNFIECMRSREKPHCDEITGYKVMVAIALSVESYRQGKVKMFDPEKEEVIS